MERERDREKEREAWPWPATSRERERETRRRKGRGSGREIWRRGRGRGWRSRGQVRRGRRVASVAGGSWQGQAKGPAGKKPERKERKGKGSLGINKKVGVCKVKSSVHVAALFLIEAPSFFMDNVYPSQFPHEFEIHSIKYNNPF